VITELVINHTSDQHPWFQRAREAPAGSPERDFYVWSDTDDKYSDTRIIFLDTEVSNWTWDPVAKQYYWHRFFSHQPDLNFDNPSVLKAVQRAMRFWLDLGVDGLRLDAIPYLCEREGTSNENLPETHAVLKKIRSSVDARYMNRMLLAEANQWPEDVREYFGDGVRTPMQWSPDRNAGFSRADPQRLYLPPIMDAVYGYEAVNVEAQSRDPSSPLNWMKRMLATRKTSHAFGRGSIAFLRPGNR